MRSFQSRTIAALISILQASSPVIAGAIPRDAAPTCLLTGYNIIDQQLNGGQFIGGGPAGASISAAGSSTGFDLRYENGKGISGSMFSKANQLRPQGGTNPMVNGEVTIPKAELGLPDDLKWKAGFMITYQSCSLNNGQYKGYVDTDYCKNQGALTLCSACTVKFPCQADLPIKKKCVVNSSYKDSWNEYGMARYRVVFSAVNTDPAAYCDQWNKCGVWTNIQCGFDSKVDGGTWRIDVSTAVGKPGADMHNMCIKNTRDAWIAQTGCTTG